MKPIADALEISRSHLMTSLTKTMVSTQKRKPANSLSDQKLVYELKSIVGERPSYGYRRACAVLNRNLIKLEQNRVNHKRVYRVMKEKQDCCFRSTLGSNLNANTKVGSLH